MDREYVLGILSRGIVFAVFVATVLYLVGANGYVSRLLEQDISFLAIAALLSGAVALVAAILNISLAGDMARALVTALRALAAGVFIALTLMLGPFDTAFTTIGAVFLGATILAVVYILGSTMAERRKSNFMRAVFTAAALIIGGYLLTSILWLASGEPGDAFATMADIVLIVFAITAAAALFGIFARSENIYIAYLCNRFAVGGGLVMTFLIAGVIAFYLIILRDLLLDLDWFYGVIIEWLIVIGVAAAIFMSMRSYVASTLSEELRFGTWTKHVQRITVKKDRLGDVSASIERFIAAGEKEHFIAFLTMVLLENGVPLNRVAQAISPVVTYHDLPSPALSWYAHVDQAQAENQRRRKAVVDVVLETSSTIVRRRDSAHAQNSNQTTSNEAKTA